MNIIRRIKQAIRAWRIRAVEQDINWAIASSDAHIRGLELKLAQLRLQQYADTRAEDIARRMDRAKLA